MKMKSIIKVFCIITLCLALYSCNYVGPEVDVTEVVTEEVKNVTESAARVCATTNMYSSNIEKFGFCYDFVPMPTISDKVVSFSVDEVYYLDNYSFNAVLKNLSPGETYYVRAFIQNEYSIAYGNEVAFTTKSSK